MITPMSDAPCDVPIKIDLTVEMPPLWPAFGGDGSVLPYYALRGDAEIRPSLTDHIVIDWAARGVGFGQACISDEYASVEGMSRNFIAAMFRRYIMDAAWSSDGWRDAVEIIPEDIRVRVVNTETLAGLQYTSRGAAGTIYFSKQYRNFGEVDMVDISDSGLKSVSSVIAIVFAWLESIPEWS